MAVEARHLNLFPPQQQIIMSNRDLMNPNQGNGYGYNNQIGSGLPMNTTPLPDNSFFPFHHSTICDSVQPKTSLNTESGLSYNLPTTVAAAAAPRKRSRDSFNQFNAFSSTGTQQTSSVVGDDVLPLLQQYQLDIDQIISLHTKKIRLDLEERQKHQARVLLSAIGEGVSKKLKEKDEQIQRMLKLNMVLQERVKSLYFENQVWRDLAQTNEATANTLRNNLEQVLAHFSDERFSAAVAGVAPAVEEDVESCCGSTDGADAVLPAEEVGRALAVEAQDNGVKMMGMCKRCGERESCVLLLPCRHLCLCTVCGSTLIHACPVCNSSMNGTVHVNMSS